MPTFQHDGIAFAYSDAGAGPPFVFQHGLGGDARQPASQAPDGCRLLTLECRGHGATALGPPEALGFTTFARDVEALLDWLGLEQVILGGISMGAGIALRLALLSPHRVRALVLVRPAWMDRHWPRNLHVCAEIAALLREHGPQRGKELFIAESREYRRARAASPALAQSLAAQFDRPQAAERAAVLERLPADRPIAPTDDLQGLTLPALVIGARQDIMHPFAYAPALAERLTNARLCEVPPKDGGDAAHQRAVAKAIASFIASLAAVR